MTDKELLAMEKVTPVDAARYLHTSPDTIREGLRQGVFPFGAAIKAKGSTEWTFIILPRALVHYAKFGNCEVI